MAPANRSMRFRLDLQSISMKEADFLKNFIFYLHVNIQM